MKPEQKAYKIDATSLEEPYFCPDNTFYGTRSDAKQEALRELNFNSLQDKNGDDFTFLNVRVKRAPKSDLYMVDGKLKTGWQIEEEKAVNEKEAQLQAMLSDNPENSFAYIKKRGVYYGPNNCGYTDSKQKAGVYTLKDAVSTCSNMSLSDNMWPELIDKEIHNEMIRAEIERLKTKLVL